MTEKGLLVTSQPGGKSVAARDAYELDDNSNARIIQQYDFSSSPLAATFPTTNPTRTNLITVDTFDMDNLPVDLTDHLLDCKDGSRLIVVPRFTGAGKNARVIITPLMFDDEATPECIGFLPYISIDSGESHVDTPFTRSGGATGIGRPGIWDLVGSPKIGLHNSYVDLQGSTNIELWGFIV